MDKLPKGELLDFGGTAFGTSWAVRVVAARPLGQQQAAHWVQRLRAEVETVLALVDRQMSPWHAGSSLNAYNRLPAGAAMALPEPMRTLVADAIALQHLTCGAFDPFIGAATDLWGFGPLAHDPTLTDRERTDRLANRADPRPPAMIGAVLPRCCGHRLDLCGIAKGLAVDLVAGALAADPMVAALLVEIGGELTGRGLKPDALPWWVDLAWQAHGAAAPMRIGLHGWACASSGITERNYTRNGRLYSHAIDPQRCEPVDGDLAGVTVLDRACWRADALATALLVAGNRRARAMADALSIPCVLVPREAGSVHVSAALQPWLDDD